MKCQFCDGKVIKVFKPLDIPSKKVKFKKYYHKCIQCSCHFYFITNLDDLVEDSLKKKKYNLESI